MIDKYCNGDWPSFAQEVGVVGGGRRESLFVCLFVLFIYLLLFFTIAPRLHRQAPQDL